MWGDLQCGAASGCNGAGKPAITDNAPTTGIRGYFPDI